MQYVKGYYPSVHCLNQKTSMFSVHPRVLPIPNSESLLHAISKLSGRCQNAKQLSRRCKNVRVSGSFQEIFKGGASASMRYALTDRKIKRYKKMKRDGNMNRYTCQVHMSMRHAPASSRVSSNDVSCPKRIVIDETTYSTHVWVRLRRIHGKLVAW